MSNVSDCSADFTKFVQHALLLWLSIDHANFQCRNNLRSEGIRPSLIQRRFAQEAQAVRREVVKGIALTATHVQS